MSYLTQSQTSNRKLIALGIAAIIHVFLGYALITGLAQNLVKKIVEPIKTIDVKEEKPPEEKPPPPPEKLVEIPVVTPPPEIQVQQQQAPTITTVVTREIPKVAPTVAIAPPPPPTAVAPPPAPPAAPAVGAHIRGNPQSLITSDDYPDASLRAEEEGTTVAKLGVNERGRVDSCVVVGSSGHRRLDDAMCSIATRRFRYDPAKAVGGASIRQDNVSFRFKWVVPKG